MSKTGNRLPAIGYKRLSCSGLGCLDFSGYFFTSGGPLFPGGVISMVRAPLRQTTHSATHSATQTQRHPADTPSRHTTQHAAYSMSREQSRAGSRAPCHYKISQIKCYTLFTTPGMGIFRPLASAVITGRLHGHVRFSTTLKKQLPRVPTSIFFVK